MIRVGKQHADCNQLRPCDGGELALRLIRESGGGLARNLDGTLDGDDLGSFIACYFTEVQSPGGCPEADFDGSGAVDGDDLGTYIAAYFAAGSC